MDSKILGKRLRQIRLMMGLTQKELATATYLAQPVISRLENGEEVYASVLLSVLYYYQGKVSLDRLFAPDFVASKEKLTPQKMFFLLLNEMGYDKKDIARILSISDTSVNTLYFRTKPIE